MATSHAPASRDLLLGLLLTLAAPYSIHASTQAMLQSIVGPACLLQNTQEADEQSLQKYLVVLEKRPRLGTAFDRVYGAYLQQGKLDELVSRYEAKGSESEGSYLLLLGLIEMRRGHDAIAIERLKKASESRPADPIVPYYLSQAFQASGNFKDAAIALERCLEIGPAPTDLFDVYQSLARAYQRGLEHEKAVEVWKRLEEKMPNDVRVLEQIANRLAEDGNWQPALERYGKLIPLTEDDYRRSSFQLAAAQMKSELGRREEAIADLEAMTAKLNPDSWLYAEARRRIEETFTRSGDLAGLSAYYEKSVGAHPDDLDALVRLSRVLNDQGRSPEARKWLDKALKVAPKNRGIRETLIQLLVSDKDFKAAQSEYATLAEQNPNDLELLHAWGETILKDRSLEVTDRQKKVGDVWRKVLAERTGDAVVVAQVADWFRQAKLADDALALYDQAIAIDPKSPQYREYKGHYLHELGRGPEAIAVWNKIADGELRSAENLSRLAQILANFGYVDEALKALTESVTLDPRSFENQLRLAELLHRKQQFDDALSRLSLAEEKAESEADLEAVLDLRLRVLSDSDKLAAAIDRLREKLKQEGGSEKQWGILSRYCETAGRQEEADIAIREAVSKNPRSVPVLTQAARLFENHGQLLEAIGHFRTLAEIDSRFRSEHLMSVVQIETRLGRTDQAIDAGKKLLEAAPGNPEGYRMFSDLLFKLGRNDEGIDILRRAIRLNPTDTELLSQLAHAHDRLFQTADAIELYWQVFEKAEALEDKLATIAELTNLYSQRDDIAGLIQRLERPGSRAQDERTIQFCVAQAHQSAGDPGAARRVLEQLRAQDPRDTHIIQQLASLAQQEQDQKGAAQYLRELRKYAPSSELDLRLANVLIMIKENEEARSLWLEVISKDESIARVLDAMDRLLFQQQYDLVSRLAKERLKENPNDWELLFRDAVALARSKRNAEAVARFDEILSLALPDESLSTMSKTKPTGGSMGGSSRRAQANPSQLMAQDVYALRSELQMDRNSYSYSAQAKKAWHPATFGSARMGCFAWKWYLTSSDAQEDFVRQVESKVEKDARRLQDLYYLKVFLNDHEGALRVSADLVKTNSNRRTRFQFLTASMYFPKKNDEKASSDEITQLELTEADAMLVDSSLSTEEWASIVGLLHKLKQKDKAVAAVEKKLRSSPTIEDDIVVLRTAATVIPPPKFIEEFGKFIAHRSNQPEFKRFEPATSEVVQYALINAGDQWTPEYARQLYARYEEWCGKKMSAPTRRPVRTGAPNPIRFYIIKNQQYIDRTFVDPQPSERFSANDLSVLRAAWCVHEMSQESDPIELSRSIQSIMDKVPVSERIRAHLILSYLASWNQDVDESIAQLKKASELAADDNQLRMDLADAIWKRGDEDRAMQVIEKIEPKGQTEIVRLEKMRFELLIALGDDEKAKASAEKLFGMPISMGEQILLAQSMHRLGMRDQAENVLRRAQTSAGNRLEDLQQVAMAFSNQGKKDLASEVARRILQQSDPSNERQTHIRQNALSLLQQAGQLDGMIARVSEQLKASPNSIHLYEQLQSYYEAAGKTDEATKLLEQLSKVQSLDPKQSLSLAMSFARQKKVDPALNFLKTALENDPNLYRNQYWEINQAFQQCNKLDAAADVIIAALSKDPSSQMYDWQAGELIESLARSPGQKDAAFSLFERLWKKDPTLTDHIHSTEFWTNPKLSKYYEELLIPPKSVSSKDTWWGIRNISSYDGNGTINCPLQRILDGADKPRLETLAEAVSKANVDQPEWIGGRAIHAIILAKQGHAEEAKKLLDALLADNAAQMPSTSAWIIGSLLIESKNLNDRAITFIERADDNDESNLDYPYCSKKLAFEMHITSGNKQNAHDLLMDAYKQTFDGKSNDEYRDTQRARSRVQIAQDLLKTESSFEILLLSQHIFDDIDLTNAARYGMQTNLLDSPVESAISMIKSPQVSNDDLKRGLELLLNSPREWRLDPVVELGIIRWKTQSASKQLPTVCLFAETVSRLASERDYLKSIRDKIAARASENPESLNALVAMAILDRWLLDDAAARQASLKGVVAYIESHPFEALEAGRKPTTRDERLAKSLIAPWFLLAYYSGEASDYAELNVIRQFTREAATRIISEPDWLVTLVLDDPKMIGGPDEFASQYRMLIDTVLDRVKKSEKSKAGAIQPCTTTQFENIQKLSDLAIQRGRPDLSIEAIRVSLEGGLPVSVGVAANASQGRRVLTSVSSVATAFTTLGNSPEQSVPANRAMVNDAILKLSPKWKKAGAPADSVYKLLLSQVVPESSGQKPQITYLNVMTTTLGPPLVDWAIASNQSDELVKALASTENKSKITPENLRSLTLRTILASRVGDEPAIKTAINDWTDYLAKDKSAETAVVATSQMAKLLKSSDDVARISPVLQIVSPRLPDQQSYLIPTIYGSMIPLYLRDDKLNELRSLLDEWHAGLQSNAPAYAKYRNDLNKFLAQGNLLVDRLKQSVEYLTVQADQPRAGGIYRCEPEMLMLLGRRVMALPAKERYELLRDWTIPIDPQKSVRVMISAPMTDAPSKDLLAALTSPANADAVKKATVGGNSSLEWLIEAARETNMFDDLAAKVQEAKSKKTKNAEYLRYVVEVSRGNSKEVSTGLRSTLLFTIPAKAASAGSEQEGQVAWAFILINTCFSDPSLEMVGLQTINLLRGIAARAYNGNIPQNDMRWIVTKLLDLGARSNWNGVGLPPLGENRRDFLKHWLASDLDDRSRAFLFPTSWWVADGKSIKHVDGRGESALFYRYPLTGTFEVTGQCNIGFLQAANISLGAHMLKTGSDWVLMQDVGSRYSAYQSQPRRLNDKFVSVRIKTSPNKVEWYLDDKLVFTDGVPQPNSPWLSLRADGLEESVWSNLKIEGTPVIPREVDLIAGGGLAAWYSPARMEKVRLTPPPTGFSFNGIDTSQEFEWDVVDGELIGRKATDDSHSLADSLLVYGRPMGNGESIEYEFYYDPEKVGGYPSFGRYAFLFDGDGVKTHWILSTSPEWTGLNDKNMAKESQYHLGDKPLPLKPGDWNAVQFKFKDDAIEVTLNGQPIFKRPVAAGDSRQFGLYHRVKQEQLRVRNIKLKGDWPESLTDELRANLASPTDDGAKEKLAQFLKRLESNPTTAVSKQ